VLKDDKSNEVKELHSLNIELKEFTILVSKLSIINSFKLLQPENILAILLTFLVLKFDKSKDIKLVQLSNIYDIV
jgi:hypothetical protein